MKYVTIDLETTGVPDRKGSIEGLQILEFGAIIEDTLNPLSYDDIPKYNRIIAHETLSGGVFALNMNARIIKILAERERYKVGSEGRKAYDEHHGIIELSDLAKDFFEFLIPYFGKTPEGDEFEKALTDADKYKQAPIYITPAGKNFGGFDKRFIEEQIPKWDQYVRLRYTTIDPTTPFIDWYEDDIPPGLGKCLERSGIIKKVSHCAVEDCWDTIEVLRKTYKIGTPWRKVQK